MSHRIAPRRVVFDPSRTPRHRIPGEPTATHAVNMPRPPPTGERWFVKVFDACLLPSWRELSAASARSLLRSYHLSGEGLLGRTVAYVERSQAPRKAS